MEAAELILTFIADIIHYIAWPAVVITIFVLLANPIKALIARIKQARVKRGDTEVIFDLMAALQASSEEKPDVIPFADLTPENLNWATFINLASDLETTKMLYLLSVPPDMVAEDPAFVHNTLATVEIITSLLKDYVPPAESAAVQKHWKTVRRRLAPILDNPT